MKRIIKHSRLRLAPTVLDGAALLACNDDPTTEIRTITADAEIETPAATEWSDEHREPRNAPATAGCSAIGWAAFLPGSRHVPKS